MQPLALVNGSMLPQADARLALNDAGFVFGATVTDLCRTFRRRPYRWAGHLARFRQSCRSAYLEVPYADGQISEWATELIAHNGRHLGAAQELAVVLLATPGPIGYYLGEPGGAGDRPGTFILHTFPLPFGRYEALVRRGAELVVPGVRHVPAEAVDPRIKQRSRMHWWLAEQEARRTRPGSQALLLDADGHATETAAANFVIVRDGALVSPPPESILGGVSLGALEELGGKVGVPLAYRPLPLADCLAADEALLCSTPYCVAGVRSINDTELAFPGPILRRLLEAWNEEVGLDIHGQILAGA